MKNVFVLVFVLMLCLCLAGSLHAQTTPPIDTPTQHFIVNGGFTAFTGAGAKGTSTASIAGIAFQLTPRVSLGYLHIDTPAIEGRWELGVANYTLPLSSLLGKKISSHFVFDPSTVNVTFQAGAGKLLQPTANRIAETGGVFLSYPLSNHISLQMFGLSVLHGGIQTGFVTVSTTEALSTGLNFSF